MDEQKQNTNNTTQEPTSAKKLAEVEKIHQKRHTRSKKRIVKRVVAIVILLAVCVAGFYCYDILSGVKPDGTSVVIEIKEGSSAAEIADTLKDNGLIKSSYLFLYDLKKSEYANSLRFGVYEIETGASHEDIIVQLSKGGELKNGVTVTIPEGYSVERIKSLLIEKGLTTDEEFEAAMFASYDYDFLTAIPSDISVKYPLQGFLFPTTYTFSTDMTTDEIVKMMLTEFGKQLNSADISYDNLYENIIVASLIEREAKIASERATISGVIKNRINIAMPLQIDASVVYVITDGLYNVDKVLYSDLEIDSPYNTYKCPALPIGPICSPGIESIKAAIKPEEHDYYYYRTDNEKADGSHIFTKTLNEHKSAAN